MCHADSERNRPCSNKDLANVISSSCDFCREGAYNLCADTIFAATPPWDGTLQKYYIVASDYCYPIPNHMSFEDGAMVEPTAVAVQICKVADVRANQTVVVFGCGPIGVLGYFPIVVQRSK